MGYMIWRRAWYRNRNLRMSAPGEPNKKNHFVATILKISYQLFARFVACATLLLALSSCGDDGSDGGGA